MPAVQIQSAVGQHTGGTTTTLSTAIATSGTPLTSTSLLDEGFTGRLIEAVKAQPCLYNPSHEHYGNKHSSAQYRIQVWQKLRIELGFKGIFFYFVLLFRFFSNIYIKFLNTYRSIFCT